MLFQILAKVICSNVVNIINMVSNQLFYLSFIFQLSGLEIRLYNLKIILHVILHNLNVKVIYIFYMGHMVAVATGFFNFHTIISSQSGII